MKKIIILMLVVLFLTGCRDTKEKKQETAYSEYLFSDVIWTRNTENDVETIRFSSDGSFSYSCSCGNPVNDSDLCESYTYNGETKEITLDCFEETKDTITTIKIVSLTDTTLELDFNGKIRKFEKSE